MRSITAVLLVLAACSKKEPEALDTAYNAFKHRNFILKQTFPGGRTLSGSISVDQSREVRESADWVEIALNGDEPFKSTGVSSANFGTKFRPGPNKVTLFSSRSLRFWEFDVDARLGTRIEITPRDKDEWTLEHRKDE